MVHFIIIHIFFLVFLHHLEMSIFIVSGPVWILDLWYPFIATCLELRFLDFIFGIWNPVIDIGEIIWFKSSVHHFHTIPRNIPTWCQWFSTINLQNMSCYLRWSIFVLINSLYYSDVRNMMALATSSTVPILYKGMLLAALFLNC
jgi:hypothetical protein